MINSKTIQYPFSASDMMCLVEYSGGNPVYIGRAAAGTATSAAAWQVQKLTYDVDGNVTAIQFAGGTNDYNQVWDDRATLTYS